MDKLQRIIIPKSESGYMFSIKDLGHPYAEAAPVNKVANNGPADCAGLRSGDGVVAINSHLVKGKIYIDICNIIKSCQTTTLELTVIRDYCRLTMQPNKREVQSTSSVQKYSPILIRKKAYTYDNETLKGYSAFNSGDNIPYESANEFFSEDNGIEICNVRNQNLISPMYSAMKPKISFKRAKNNQYKAAAKSDLDISSLVQVSSHSTSYDVISHTPEYDQTRLVYHPAYRHTCGLRTPNSKSASEPQQNDFTLHDRRGSTSLLSNSSSLSISKIGFHSQTKINLNDRSRTSSRNLSISPCNTQTSSSPILQLNRVGGFVRAPLSIEETLHLDRENEANIDSMSNVFDKTITPSGRSSCEFEKIDGSNQQIPPTTKQHTIHPIHSISPKFKCRPLSNPYDVSITHSDTNFDVFDRDLQYYQTCSTDDTNHNNHNFEYKHDLTANSHSKHFKKLKNIFGDNYRCRSKTLDSEDKLRDNEICVKVLPTSVLVKWIIREGKAYKTCWKQYLLNIDENRLVFCREKSPIVLKSPSLDDVVISINLLNATVDDEPEKRGRKNTLRLQQGDKQNGCLIEFCTKSLTVNWLRIISERSKLDMDARDSRNGSFKKSHSLTAPSLLSKDSNQEKFKMSRTKYDAISLNPISATSTTQSATQHNKGVIYQAMSRVKNLKHKFNSSVQGNDFEKQQEEWFNKTDMRTTTNKLVSSNSYNGDIQSGLHPIYDSGALSLIGGKQVGNSSSFPLHKLQRSHFSHLVPLVVELCVSIIEKFGMNEIGLYRISGNKVALDLVYSELHKSPSEIDVTTDKWNDIHTISGVLKSFLRNLPDSLFPKELYSDIISACRMHEFDRERRLLSIQRFLSIMDIAQDHPEYRYHRETLHYIAVHLSRVASRHSTNKMNAKNLAVIFAPSLMKPPHETNQMLVNDYKYKIQLIETLIKHQKWLFSPTLESACNIPSDSDDDDVTKNTLLSEDLVCDQVDNRDRMLYHVKDVRPLVKRVLARATKLTNESLTHEPVSFDESIIRYNSTLAELSKEAYLFSSLDGEYAEVDIDEECEKRKGIIKSSAVEKLKNETNNILSECSKDLDELNCIHNKCLQNLSEVEQKIKEVNEEIVKTECLLEKKMDQSILSTNISSDVVDTPSKHLPYFSAASVSSDNESHMFTNESPRALLPSTEV